ncbi:DUF1659 domain-containing protein [Bacillus massilinigeriensis]|uniref:DUF1659 domain-containing protein n=1 Tax=Bacillus mediterraneensis TaxID=1805474 RepID=UPI0008F8ED92|nr:DUF1659 domain-containing protein [Bacillus mediterraneensis]
MAMALLKGTSIRLNFEAGMNAEGKVIVKGKTYGNVNKDATATQIQQAALALSSLSAYPLITVERNDSLEIV